MSRKLTEEPTLTSPFRLSLSLSHRISSQTKFRENPFTQNLFSNQISLDREDLFFFFASVAVVVQPAMDDNNSVYVGGFPYDITDEALPYADKEIVYENSHGFERRGDDVLDRNGYKESFWRWRRRRLAWESGPTKNIKK